jgi:hypothetical protein
VNITAKLVGKPDEIMSKFTDQDAYDKWHAEGEAPAVGLSTAERVVSGRHLELLEHTLGNETHYRNYFLASDGHHDTPELEELVEMGLMVKQDATSWSCGDTVYFATEEGKGLAFAR